MYVKELTDESDIDTSWGERATLGCPSEAILENPSVEGGFSLRSQPKVWVRNTLENIVVVFGRPEDGRAWVRNIPGGGGGQELDDTTKISAMHIYQAASTSRADRNLIIACRIY